MNKIAILISTVLLISFAVLIFDSYQSKTSSVTSTLPQEEVVVSKSIAGWIPWWQQNLALTNLETYGENIDEVYFTWLYLHDYGLEFKINSANYQAISRLKADGVVTNLTISNVLGSDSYGQLPEDDEKLGILVDDIYEYVEDYEFDGINIDLEHITIEEEVKLEKFVDLITTKAHQNSVKVSIALPSISGSRHTWKGAEGIDLEYLCGKVDHAIIMMYDLHNASTSYGALSTYEWMDTVLSYTLKRCDKDKVVAGIPLYGYVWTSDGKYVETINEESLSQKYRNLTQTRDDSSSELIGIDQVNTSYISDTQSVSSKMDFVSDYGIHKFAVWHLGNLDSEISD